MALLIENSSLSLWLSRRSWEKEVLSLHRKRSTLLLGLQLRSSAGEPPNWTKLCMGYNVKPELKTTPARVQSKNGAYPKMNMMEPPVSQYTI
jgi:hypothetical protein